MSSWNTSLFIEFSTTYPLLLNGFECIATAQLLSFERYQKTWYISMEFKWNGMAKTINSGRWETFWSFYQPRSTVDMPFIFYIIDIDLTFPLGPNMMYGVRWFSNVGQNSASDTHLPLLNKIFNLAKFCNNLNYWLM